MFEGNDVDVDPLLDMTVVKCPDPELLGRCGNDTVETTKASLTWHK